MSLPIPHSSVSTSLSPQLRVFHQKSDLPLMTITDVELPDDSLPTTTKFSRTSLPVHQRLFWLPAVDTLLTVRASLDQFVLHHFNLQEELDNGDADYPFVTSTPPTSLSRGHKLAYPIEVMAKHRDVKYSL